ncbi:nickel/cobalt transporter [Vibrio sp. JC009]|uniref:nickel/cobalt transporter n=1 Tax=Vibrio sp. JC009 TaxID=2912314 RepID=UPI0023AEFCB6|nr:nickel/cobalt transporter [Vibrio sp. JC009]WED21494.1 nickel/cobalt transporter [Vibrio sp. JC009]
MSNAGSANAIKGFSAILVLTGLAFGGYLLWQSWPQILLHSMKWQKEINAELSELLYEIKEQSLIAGVYLAGLSFLYGVLHSVGPGHGKIIVTTFLATHPAKIKHGLILTCLSALMQALVAIGLVTFLLLIFGNSMRDVTSKADLFISASFLAMCALGGTIIWRTSKILYRHKKNARHAAPTCCRHHHHSVSAADINSASNWKSYAGIIISIGIRPCTGAIMVLMFSHITGIYWVGVVSAILMAVGTAITTSTIALLTVSGKKIVRRYLAAKARSHHLAGTALQFVGGTLLFTLGVILLSSRSVSVAPFLM